MMTQAQLFAAVKALPHMTITKTEHGEYRVAYRLYTIKGAKPDWSKDRIAKHEEATSYYTEDREDALGSAKSLSDHMVGLLDRMARKGTHGAAQALPDHITKDSQDDDCRA